MKHTQAVSRVIKQRRCELRLQQLKILQQHQIKNISFFTQAQLIVSVQMSTFNKLNRIKH